MNNFGVIEIASAKTTSAPGWAYVPDTGSSLERTLFSPRTDIEALEKDSGKESIPVPAKSGKAAQNKHTPNVRKILQSQKTYANHLDDFYAMQAQAEAGTSVSSSNLRANVAASGSKRPLNKKDAAASVAVSAVKQPAIQDEDTSMADADLPPLLVSSFRPPPAAHPGDSNPLLMSRVPEMPTDDELRKLLAHPALTYYEARGKWEDTYPTRVFCEVCGYWGRVKCMKCGTRVCALGCLETHREECFTRYGL
ncbi:hypothetical protein PT974_11722 [Cladobotryum mycophilum]|uniref:HIT-type domain-containing protein n=1 Tax=Cladobotryum mycophilum TaxID=491253 RepID=A0ABR0S718_9HYPO